ncbi:MAG TPA: DAK2 domain-containing protein [Jatrophihabitans sp.]|uniref:DAK2 domain-containing protein n=1 Tax=Jatrophihabitans sp. TaxID=1932789 RepID=UPI002E048A1E|nr:DAK2 domain-containing protein [Jatrophihabitans sp.]
MLDVLDSAAVRHWSRAAVEVLRAHRGEIDALNVFPVPDSDTGSNLLVTMLAAADSLAVSPCDDVAGALAELAAGAALGAVGNSGFIVSQLLRGLAESAAAEPGECGGRTVAAGLGSGAVLARAAVVTPVEGTILSVAQAAADAVAGSERASLGDVVTTAVRAADAALQRTPDQLAELHDAGVVDAGGRGLVVLLNALARTVTGASVPTTPVHRPAHRPALVDPHEHEDRSGFGFGFEVQYLLESTEPQVRRLSHRLADLGDSVAIVPAGLDVWKVHVHVDDVGAAIEVGVEAGRPHRIAVVRFADESRGAGHDHDHGDERDAAASAVVAVAPGTGLAHLFEAEGVHVVDGDEVDDVVEAIIASGARDLVLLPNASRVTGVAEAAARQVRARGLRVSVVPTRSPVQGLAAIAVHDPTRRFDDDVVAMAEAAAATRFAQVTIARDEALTAVGICQPGDVLGLIDGEVVAVGRGMLAVAFTLVDRLLAVGAELMTVLVGADAPPRIGELVEAHVRGRAPLTDVSVYQGGQPDHPVIIGVE